VPLEKLVPLSGHAVFLLLIQLSLLLVVARAGAELAKRLSLPAVVGELAAGIALGPSLFGHVWPVGFELIFPRDAMQYQLLEVVALLGMVLLLLITGLETDLRLLRNLGRSALIASATGMVLPFVLGFALGWLLPVEFLADPDGRLLFALFLATTMSISAMPVIAKILMDLDLTRRNIGLVILSAGVVDDTIGWIILSIIAGAATHGGLKASQLGEVAQTLGLTLGLLVATAFVVYPVLRWLMRLAAERFATRDSDLVLIIGITFLYAAATEWIGVHAVFGAFVLGTVLKQVPRLRDETVHRIESFTFAILAPIFFGLVGLKVDLWQLEGWGVPLLVLAVACVGKLVGCSVGALWGGLRFWEAASIAVAMNARGAMGLVAATIGLSLGILNDAMFSIIVMMAVVTSFMAPLGLRLTMRMVRMTEEEARRIDAEQARGAFDPERVRVLVPTAGGPNALGAARLAFAVARRSESPVTVMFVDEKMSRWDRVRRLFVKNPAGQGLEGHLTAMRALADGARPPEVRRVTASTVAGAILDEARKEYDLIVLGASRYATTIGGDVLADVVAGAPCHVAVMRIGDDDPVYKKIIVPVDGSLVSRIAVEFAARYAEITGAELTIALLTEHRPQAAAYSDDVGTGAGESAAPISEEELERVSRVFRTMERKPTILRVDYDPSSSALAAAVATGTYDLVVIGAENRAVQNRLFFGYENERILQTSQASVAVVVPHLGRLPKAAPGSSGILRQ
jgi:Kef-type K+ transport system membrane component KefB/nucleotide-binding universal stress UspA family protein